MQIAKTVISLAVLLAVGAHAEHNSTAPANATTLAVTPTPTPTPTPAPTPAPTPTPTPTPTPKPANGTAPSTADISNAILPGTAIPYGAVREAPVGPRTVDDLMLAMMNRTNYAEQVARPICIIEVKKVLVQVVAGVNYRFTVEGCSQTFSETLGLCNEAGCKSPALWEVSVFSQPWTNTYRVDKIDFVG